MKTVFSASWFRTAFFIQFYVDDQIPFCCDLTTFQLHRTFQQILERATEKERISFKISWIVLCSVIMVFFNTHSGNWSLQSHIIFTECA